MNVDQSTALAVFRLDGREFGLSVSMVREILRMVALVPVPEAPAWLAGVLNLRGRLVPVVNLRTRFTLPARPPGARTRILITERHDRLLGLLADDVVDVITVPAAAVARASEIAAQGQLVSAMARFGDRLILILDLERLVEVLDGTDAPADAEHVR